MPGCAPDGDIEVKLTGGEPLVRKADIIKLCEKHNDCAFHAFTNGTLVDEAFLRGYEKSGESFLVLSAWKALKKSMIFAEGTGYLTR